MSDIPGTPREFERWADPLSRAWPLELQLLAGRALLSLKSMKQPAFGQSLAMQCGAARDLQAFVTAYEAHRTTCSTNRSPEAARPAPLPGAGTLSSHELARDEP